MRALSAIAYLALCVADVLSIVSALPPSSTSVSLRSSTASMSASATKTLLSPVASCLYACKSDDSSCQATCIGLPPASVQTPTPMTSAWFWSNKADSTSLAISPTSVPPSSAAMRSSTASGNSSLGHETIEHTLSGPQGAGIGIAAFGSVVLILKALWCVRHRRRNRLAKQERDQELQDRASTASITEMGLYCKPELSGESSCTVGGEKLTELQANEIPAHELPEGQPVHELPA